MYQHLKNFSKILPALLCAQALGACALDEGADGTSGVLEEELDTPSTLTIFSEAGFWGDQLVAEVLPTTDAIAQKGIYAAEMQAANMVGRASSARLHCGSRPTDAYFFGSDKFFTGGEWIMISCTPGHDAEVNLHTATSTPGHKILGDKVLYALVVDRTVTAWPVFFSDSILDAWDNQIGDFLGSGAYATSGGVVNFKWGNQFRLRQAVHINTPWYCQDASGWFEYSAGFTMGTTGRPNWAVYSTAGVSGGTPCHDSVESAFKSKVTAGQATFATQLNSATDLGSHASYFFVPSPTGTDVFDLDFGPL